MKTKELLNEYLVRPGYPITEVLALNVFEDTLNTPLSRNEPSFADNPQWVTVERAYAKTASTLEALINKAERGLTDDEAEEVNYVWYDGSDAYDDPRSALMFLLPYWDEQIRVVMDILGIKKSVLPALKKTIRRELVASRRKTNEGIESKAQEIFDILVGWHSEGQDLSYYVAFLKGVQHSLQQALRAKSRQKFKDFLDHYGIWGYTDSPVVAKELLDIIDQHLRQVRREQIASKRQS